MPDLSQELADVQAAGYQLERKAPAPSAPPEPEKVTLRHPLTGDVQVVDATPEKLTPFMIRGYAQAPANPAKGN